jgi:hypothetical protein
MGGEIEHLGNVDELKCVVCAKPRIGGFYVCGAEGAPSQACLKVLREKHNAVWKAEIASPIFLSDDSDFKEFQCGRCGFAGVGHAKEICPLCKKEYYCSPVCARNHERSHRRPEDMAREQGTAS